MLCLQHLEKQEEAAGGVCITKPLPLRMSNEKAWQVILVSADVPHWPYRIHDGEKLKVSASIRALEATLKKKFVSCPAGG